VFEFYSHVTPDNDRCINFDRQRIEIKTYDPSPSNLKGVLGETITYKWKFKLAVGYKPSSSFTHIHQIKAVGGNDGDPIFTLTPRKGSPNKIELKHDNTTVVATADLLSFEGVWVECTEVLTVGAACPYSMIIKRVSDGIVLLSYSNNSMMTIRADNNFIRPKWGIYRSLNSPADLRDEAVRFAGFSIQEGTTGIETAESRQPLEFQLQQNYPNPFNPETVVRYQVPGVSGQSSGVSRVDLRVYDLLGREVAVLVNEVKPAGRYAVTWDASNMPSGLYFYTLQTGEFRDAKLMTLIK